MAIETEGLELTYLADVRVGDAQFEETIVLVLDRLAFSHCFAQTHETKARSIPSDVQSFSDCLMIDLSGARG